MKDNIFGEIMDMKSAHEIWIYLNKKYGAISDDDDDDHKEEAHEDVEHCHNPMIVEDCSTSWSSDDDDDHATRSLDKIDDDATRQPMMILHAHLMVMMMVHASDMRVMLLQALQHHHIASCDMVTQRYLLVV